MLIAYPNGLETATENDPCLRVVEVVTVDVFAAVQAVSQLSIVTVCADANVTRFEVLVQVAFPMLYGTGLFDTLIVSPP